MNIEKMTSKQLATEILARKIANKENELFIKKGLEELRNRKVNDIVCKYGMIYSVDESQKKQVNQAKINEFLEQFGKTLKESNIKYIELKYKSNFKIPSQTDS